VRAFDPRGKDRRGDVMARYVDGVLHRRHYGSGGLRRGQTLFSVFIRYGPSIHAVRIAGATLWLVSWTAFSICALTDPYSAISNVDAGDRRERSRFYDRFRLR
jgi:hypothetical protein